MIASRVEACDLSAHVWSCRDKSDLAARQRCLSALVHVLVELGVTRLVIESNQHQDERDRRVLAKELRHTIGTFTYEHLKPAEDPILWVADAVAWCHGAGGDWSRRLRGTIRCVQLVD